MKSGNVKWSPMPAAALQPGKKEKREGWEVCTGHNQMCDRGAIMRWNTETRHMTL